jgi:cytochrome c oxidase subunit II
VIKMHQSATVTITLLAAAVISAPGAAARVPPASATGAREFTITARRAAFTPAKIEVTRGDVVKITLIAEDIPHTFTIDSYRISKRASPGQNATIEFHAEIPGSHVYYCSLTTEDCCHHMRGELVVR